MLSRKKQLAINLIATLTAFIINGGISFFLTSYITKTIGVEAYGFVALGANFINYASLATIALNSMANRFITIEIHKNNWDNANKYFSSVLFANIIVAGVMIIPSILIVAYLDRIVEVPLGILSDVRLLFSLLFANYLMSIIVSSFGVSTFATNKLYLKSLRDIESKILKALLLIGLFLLFKPAVSFLGFSSLMVLMYTGFFDIYYTKKLLPRIRIKKSYFDMKAVFELIKSGIWNTVIQVGQIILHGVDLLISNLALSATAMGTLALAKTIPTLILSLVGVISVVFIPDFTILYTQNKPKELLESIKQSMTILSVIVTIPIAILVSFGEVFFKLWVPTEDPKVLQILSIITIGTLVVSGPINSIYGVFIVTNKLKTNALVLLATGVLNLMIVFILLKTTNLGLFAIAGVSSILGIIRNLVFTAPFGAKYLGLKWNVFYPEIFKSVASFIFVSFIGITVSYFFDIKDWSELIILSLSTAFIGLIANLMIFLSKSERTYLKRLVKQKLWQK